MTSHYDSSASGDIFEFTLYKKANNLFEYRIRRGPSNNHPITLQEKEDTGIRSLPEKYRKSVSDMIGILRTPEIKLIMDEYCTEGRKSFSTAHPDGYHISLEENDVTILEWSNHIGFMFHEEMPQGILNDFMGVIEAIWKHKKPYRISSGFIKLINKDKGVEKDTMQESPSYFWVNTRPEIWSVNEISNGGEVFFTDKQKQPFGKVKTGDIVLFYEGAPTSAIVAQGVVVKDLHVEDIDNEPIKGITLRFVRYLMPVSHKLMKNCDALKDVLPLKNIPGTLFKLEETHYKTISNMGNYEQKINRLKYNALKVIEESLDEENDPLVRVQAAAVLIKPTESQYHTNIKPYPPTIQSYTKDVHYEELINQSYYDMFPITAGCVVGRALGHNGHVTMLMQVKPGDSSYTQENFEKDLKSLVEIFHKLRHGLGWNIKLSLVFKSGGTLILPDWFLEMCREYKIEVIFVEG